MVLPDGYRMIAYRKEGPMKPEKAELPVEFFKDQKHWVAWLEKHHGKSPGVWLRLAKKGSEIQSVTYAEALEVALCYGWIDGQKKSYDEASWLQKFTPRGDRSLWSKVNREKAEELIRTGRMKPAGLCWFRIPAMSRQRGSTFERESMNTVVALISFAATPCSLRI